MRQLIPALLLLTLLLPAAAAAQSPVTRVQFVAALWTCSGAVPYDANGPFSDVNPNSPGALARFFDRPVPAVPYLLEHW